MINRRHFIYRIPALAAGLALIPKIAAAAVKRVVEYRYNPGPVARVETLAELFPAHFQAQRVKLRLEAGSKHWSDKRLDAICRFENLGPTYIHNGVEYEIEQVNVPVTWTQNDENRNPTKEQRTAVAINLAENANQSHDDLLWYLSENGKYDLVVSQNYHKQLGEVCPIIGEDAFYCMVYTDYVKLPRT